METDGALIECSVRGRPDAFVEVVRRHEVAVHKFLARRAGREPADDLLGEVWVRAFGARHTFRTEQDDALPWLYGIARNVLRAHWRSAAMSRLCPGGTWDAEETVDPWDEVVERLDSATWVVIRVGSIEPIFRTLLVLLPRPPAAKPPKMGHRFRLNRVCRPDRKNRAGSVPRLSRQRVLSESPEI